MSSPWSVPVAIHDVPEQGRRFDLTADENARAALAKSIGLRTLPRLQASFEVTRHGREGLRVVGQVSATVGQTCVVTLDPIDNEIEEAVDLVFLPQAEAPEERGTKEAFDDAPEPLVGGTVDLGVVATEFLILALDPYPRKSDAVFTAPAAEDKTDHPFAALAALKKGQS
jgi:uncharacterized metal-binding protein YceD (DUF177 family)